MRSLVSAMGNTREVGIKDIVDEAISTAAGMVMNKLGTGISTITRVVRSLLSSAQVVDALAGAFGQGIDSTTVTSFIRHVALAESSLEPIFRGGVAHPHYQSAAGILAKTLSGAVQSERLMTNPLGNFIDHISSNLLEVVRRAALPTVLRLCTRG